MSSSLDEFLQNLFSALFAARIYCDCLLVPVQLLQGNVHFLGIGSCSYKHDLMIACFVDLCQQRVKRRSLWSLVVVLAADVIDVINQNYGWFALLRGFEQFLYVLFRIRVR